MSGQSGIIYHSLVSEYDGDTTKECGLTVSEMDGNFHFLRGKGISSVSLEDSAFTITLLNGETYRTDSFEPYFTELVEGAMSGFTEQVDELRCTFSSVSESVEEAFNQIDILREEEDGKIESLSGQIETINEKIEEIINEIPPLESRVSDNEDNIAVLRREVTSSVGVLTENLETVSGRLNAKIDDVSDFASGKAASLNGRIDELEATVRRDKQELVINTEELATTLQQEMNEKFSAAGEIMDTAFESLSSTITNLEGEVKDYADNLCSQYADETRRAVSDVSERVREAEETITSISRRIDGMEGSMPPILEEIQNVRAEVASVREDISALERRVDDLEEWKAIAMRISDTLGTRQDEMLIRVENIERKLSKFIS